MNSPSSRRCRTSLADLARILQAHGFSCQIQGNEAVAAATIAYDSRSVSAGDLFLALPGTKTDGSRFIADAVRAGAVAVACSPGESSPDVPCLVIEHVDRAAGHIAAALFGNPADSLRLVGVTGTNGKTSCTYILESILLRTGRLCGVLGTVSERWPGHERSAAMTTPPAVEIQRALADMVAAGCTWAALEVSSHALTQHRVAGCHFDAAIFTNLTRDHLDYHGDEETYFAAKARLFLDHLAPDNGMAVLNADDRFAMRLHDVIEHDRCRTYSIVPGGSADVGVLEATTDIDGIRATLRTPAGQLRVESRLLGAPNLSNIAAVVAAAESFGLPLSDIEEGLRACAPVPGRLERVGDGRPVVLVDYAHTPDALERTLEAVRAHTLGRLVVVFGCGGDRDRGKRPMMGRIASERADVVVLTSDNPRSEDPHVILDDIEAGMTDRLDPAGFAALRNNDAQGYLVEADRERAIAAALGLASARDVVVVAGKGHENYQEVAGKRRHFDDRETVRRLQRSR